MKITRSLGLLKRLANEVVFSAKAPQFDMAKKALMFAWARNGGVLTDSQGNGRTVAWKLRDGRGLTIEEVGKDSQKKSVFINFYDTDGRELRSGSALYPELVYKSGTLDYRPIDDIFENFATGTMLHGSLEKRNYQMDINQ